MRPMFHHLSLGVEFLVTTGAIIFLGSLGFSLVLGIVRHFFVPYMNLAVLNQLYVLAKFMAANCALIIFDVVVDNFHMPMKVFH